MNNVYQTTIKTLLMTLLLLLTVSACSGGGSDKPKPKPIVIEESACDKHQIGTDQTCALIGGRAVISYAPASQSQYSGVAIFLHGAPGTPTKVANIFGAKMIADQFNLVSLTPEGDGTNYQWNSSNNNFAETPDVDHLLAVIDSAQSQYTFSDNK